LQGTVFVDVGTGGGLPGIPLAIVFPERHFALLDSNDKKTRFLFQVKQDLTLSNVDVVQSRVEQYQPPFLFDGVISRAFASLNDMLTGSRHLLANGGCWYAMKGQKPDAELATLSGNQLTQNYVVKNCIELQVPNNTGERHLIIISKASIPTVAG
jgi:16S rRNA (guanine527-N7)-methyltransferase